MRRLVLAVGFAVVTVAFFTPSPWTIALEAQNETVGGPGRGRSPACSLPVAGDVLTMIGLCP